MTSEMFVKNLRANAAAWLILISFFLALNIFKHVGSVLCFGIHKSRGNLFFLSMRYYLNQPNYRKSWFEVDFMTEVDLMKILSVQHYSWIYSKF